MALHLSGTPRADDLVSRTPLALVLGMVLDQQVPLERAFSAPDELAHRLGRDLDAGAIAAADPGRLAELFAQQPALHRYPSSMAARVQATCRVIADEHGGDPARIWTDAADGRELRARIQALPGFGEQKARIFVALLAKQVGVRPRGWQDAAAPFGEPGSYRSVADIVDEESRARVRQYKRDAKAKARARDPQEAEAQERAGGTAQEGAPAAPGAAARR